MSSAIERIYSAMHTLKRDAVPLDKFVVRAHPSVLVEVERDPYRVMFMTEEGMRSFAGLPFEIDPTLDRDGIVLRYEVTA